MKPAPLLIAVLLAIFFAVMYFSRDAGYVRREKEMEKVYADSIAGIRKAFEKSITQKEHEWLIIFTQTQNELLRWEGEAKAAQQQVKNERANNRRFTDHQTDSLLSAVR